MPTYLTPGVYIEEAPSKQTPIEGVGTSVAAFIGLAAGGPRNEPLRISSWSQFERLFSHPADPERGPWLEGAYLPHAVYGFFQNGGKLCWVVRVGADDGEPARALIASANGDGQGLEAVAREGLAGPVTLKLSDEPVPADADDGDPEDGEGEQPKRARRRRENPAEPTYLVEIAGPEGASERFEGVRLSAIATELNRKSSFVKFAGSKAQLGPLAPGTYPLEPPPAPSTEVEAGQLEGNVARREGLGALAATDEVTMICVPDAAALPDEQMRDVQAKLIAHCEGAGNRMAILDPPAEARRPQDVLEWRMQTAGWDSKVAALYFPWLKVQDPLTKRPIEVPPSGHMAGVWARTDGNRGVHKAPANEVVQGVTGLAFQVAQAEQGELNRTGINCLRAFPARGIRVWGARTLSSDPEWRYVNVRRLFHYVSASIEQGTQWAVFEPNDEPLWTALKISASNFLMRAWRDGALFGRAPEEAFFVKCDEETNRPELREAGQVTIEVGIAPVKPAEFVVFRISQFVDGADQLAA
jgi:phage tail sheath protein FI